MDELTGVQALERKHSDLPMQPGHVLRREFDQCVEKREKALAKPLAHSNLFVIFEMGVIGTQAVMNLSD